MNQQQKFQTWALVELFGHNRIVGLVTEQSIGGASFIRVDVPGPDGTTSFTRMFGAAAIYAINPIGKDVAIGLAQRCEDKPVQPYELPALPERAQDDGAFEEDGQSEDGDQEDDTTM